MISRKKYKSSATGIWFSNWDLIQLRFWLIVEKSWTGILSGLDFEGELDLWEHGVPTSLLSEQISF